MTIESLVQSYTPNLLRAALSLGFNAIEAEELVQDTFVAYLDGQQRFEGRSKLLTYLFGILYNKARTARRVHAREQAMEIEDLFDSHFDAGGDWTDEQLELLSEPERQTEMRVLSKSLRECLNGLSETLRMAFSLKEVERLDTEEICRILGITTTHLGVCLFRSRNKLRDCLISKGISIV